jgi:hypothetical protein
MIDARKSGAEARGGMRDEHLNTSIAECDRYAIANERTNYIEAYIWGLSRGRELRRETDIVQMH